MCLPQSGKSKEPNTACFGLRKEIFSTNFFSVRFHISPLLLLFNKYSCYMEIYKVFRFEAAHFLPNVSETHKCRNMHGHSYKFTIYLQGEVNPQSGWLIDFHDIKTAVKPLVDELDHQVLNNINGLENPTAENITIWLWNKIKPLLPQLSKIHLKETETSGCIYEGK